MSSDDKPNRGRGSDSGYSKQRELTRRLANERSRTVEGKFEYSGGTQPRNYRTEERRLTNKKARERFFAKPGNRDRYRLKNRLQNTGITFEMLQEARERQGGRCGICPAVLTAGRASKTAECIDHCHITGRFRGLLCSYCNQSIGRFGDSREGLLRAVAYLDGRPNTSIEVVGEMV